MERPVVATRISGSTEVVQGGETGFLAEPTAAGVRDGLARILRLPYETHRRMGRLGREHVNARFGIDQIVQRMTEELIVAPVLESLNVNHS